MHIDFKPHNIQYLPLMSPDSSFKASACLVSIGQPVTKGSGIDLFNRFALKCGQEGPEGQTIIDLVDFKEISLCSFQCVIQLSLCFT